MSAVKNAFKSPSMPGFKAPSTPTRADDPAALRAREETLAKNRKGGYQQLILAPLDGMGPSTQLKQILGA